MRYIYSFKISSFQIIIGSFLAIILLGAFLLMLPISSAEGVVTPFSDALFTSTSANAVRPQSQPVPAQCHERRDLR